MNKIFFVFLRTFWKNRFCPYLRKYQYSRKITFFEKMFFAHMSKNINISRKLLYFEITLKNHVSPYFRKYQHFEENNIFLRSFQISNINIKIREKWLYLKKLFFANMWKISTFREKNVILRSLWKIVLAHIFENISISKKRMFSWDHFE